MKTINIVSVLLLSFGFAAQARNEPPKFTISTVAGNGVAGYSGGGGPATSAALKGPRCLSLDAQGSLYIGIKTGTLASGETK